MFRLFCPTVTGASDNPCSEVYAGPIAFSEPETQAVADFLESGPNFLLYLTFHSYGQYWLTPWGYTSDYPDNYNELVRKSLYSIVPVSMCPYCVYFRPYDLVHIAYIFVRIACFVFPCVRF